MTRWRFVRAVGREAMASALSQRLQTLITALVVAAMCVAVLLTAGLTAATRQAVLSAIDDVGTRTITVTATANAGLDTDILNQLGSIADIATIAAFGPAMDATNPAAPRTPVAVRALWTDPTNLAIPSGGEQAWASDQALRDLGMPDRIGNLRTSRGAEILVAGRFSPPEQLAGLEPLVVVPTHTTSPQPIAVLVITTTDAAAVAPVAEVVGSLLRDLPADKVKVATSQQLAQLRGVIEADLQGRSRDQVLMIIGAAGVLVATVGSVMAMLRRKDYGRRRALGASQALIVALVLVQTAIVGAASAVIATLACTVALAIKSVPIPGLEFITAVPVLAVATAIVAAAAPAALAANRDPLTELRVP